MVCFVCLLGLLFFFSKMRETLQERSLSMLKIKSVFPFLSVMLQQAAI